MAQGGLQKGMVAWDKESRTLDKSLRETAARLADEFKSSKLRCGYQLSLDEKIKYFSSNCVGFRPDGGAWFIGDTLVAVFEAKKQNMLGNAQERWYDNATTAGHLNKAARAPMASNLKYITFLTGAGCAKNGPLDRLATAAPMKLEPCWPGSSFVFHLNKKGHKPSFIYNTMKAVLEELLEELA